MESETIMIVVEWHYFLFFIFPRNMKTLVKTESVEEAKTQVKQAYGHLTWFSIDNWHHIHDDYGIIATYRS